MGHGCWVMGRARSPGRNPTTRDPITHDPEPMTPFKTPAEIDRAIPDVVLHLVRNGLIASPTETVYGFGSAASKEAVYKLANLKGREPGKPFLLLVSGIEMLSRVGVRLPDAADRL